MKENDGEGRGWIDVTCVAVLHAVTPCDLIWEKRRRDDHMTPIYSSRYSRLSIRQPERGAAAFKTSSIFLRKTLRTPLPIHVLLLNHWTTWALSTHTWSSTVFETLDLKPQSVSGATGTLQQLFPIASPWGWRQLESVVLLVITP